VSASLGIILASAWALAAGPPAVGQVEVGTTFIAGQNTVDELCQAANGLAKAGNTVTEASPSPGTEAAPSPVGSDVVGLIQVDAQLVYQLCSMAGLTAAASPVAEGSPASESPGAEASPASASPAAEGSPANGSPTAEESPS
jgi:hypothetical protein